MPDRNRKRAALCLLLALAGCGEIPRSQPAEVSQTIGPAYVRVVYSRPVARGRELFGGIVPWDSIWNPGADDATYISFSDDMFVDGQPLDAGNYSIWAIPRPDEWTVIFSRDWNTYHIPYPEGDDALRLQIAPEQGDHMESLGFYFPFSEMDRATLRLHWGETVIPIELQLQEPPPEAQG